MKQLLFMITLVSLFGCGHDGGHSHHHHGEEHGHQHKHGEANQHMHSSSFEDLVSRFESAERDAYQKPRAVMEYLGKMDDLTVMEIGSGTGYFSFRLVEAGANVIAADVDERFQAYILGKKDCLGIGDALQLRKVPYDSPELRPEEVDMVLIVNTYHHIENRSDYFKKVLDGLKPGGELVVIDFFKKELPVGPPPKMKLSPDEVKAELTTSGFSDFEVEDKMLDYQYIVTASKS